MNFRVPPPPRAVKPHPAARRRAVRRRRTGFAVLAAVVFAFVVALAAGGAHRLSRHRSAKAPGESRPHTRPRALPALVREDRAIEALAGRYRYIVAGGPERREVALTFDDGPGPYTPALLDELERLRAPATFFEIGFMIGYFHDSLTRELKLRDAIGDHTETHPPLASLTAARQRSQILDQAEWLRRYRAPFPHLFRPPDGSWNAETFATLHRYRMLMVLWTVDTDDYRQPGVDAIVHAALAGVRPGAIILLHDAGGTRTQTVDALPILVHDLRARGYLLVTVPRLLLDDPPIHPPPRIVGDLDGG